MIPIQLQAAVNVDHDNHCKNIKAEFKNLLIVQSQVSWVRWYLIVSIPDPLRTNSGWLPIRYELFHIMSPVNFEYFEALIYSLKLSGRYFIVSSKIVVGSVYFHYRKIVSGEIINTSLDLRGFIFIMPGYVSCGEQHKVRSESMCLFVEKF